MADDLGPDVTEASIPIAVEHPKAAPGMLGGLREEWQKLPTWGKVAVVGAAVGLGFIVYERLRSGGLGLPLPSTNTAGSGAGVAGSGSDPIFPAPTPTPGTPPDAFTPPTVIPDFAGAGFGPDTSQQQMDTTMKAPVGHYDPAATGAAVSVAQRVTSLINGFFFPPAPSPGSARGETNKSGPPGPSPAPATQGYALTAPTAAFRAMQFAQQQRGTASPPAPARTPTGVARRYGLDN